MKKFSNVTAADLIDFIDKFIGDDGWENFDVFIDERTSEIVVINRETGEGSGICAARIYYKTDTII